ncbi:MAG: hypothetical protein AB1487_11210 [Thermodesulfobacteriota bacterium]
MARKQLLFVTYHDENFEAGHSYAVNLAKTMNENISLLMIYRRRVMEKIDDLMTAVTFAEAGEIKTAKELIIDDLRKNNESYEKKIGFLMEKCRKFGVDMNVNAAATDVVSAIKNLLRQNTKIDMVLLSPSITHGGHITTRELNRLVETVSRPVVTMAKNATTEVA